MRSEELWIAPKNGAIHQFVHRGHIRAGKPVCREPLDAEWGTIAKDLPR